MSPLTGICRPLITRKPGGHYPPRTAKADAQRVCRTRRATCVDSFGVRPSRLSRPWASQRPTQRGIPATDSARQDWRSRTFRRFRWPMQRCPGIRNRGARSSVRRMRVTPAASSSAAGRRSPPTPPNSARSASIRPTSCCRVSTPPASMGRGGRSPQRASAHSRPSSRAIRTPYIFPVSRPPPWPPRRPKSQPRRCLHWDSPAPHGQPGERDAQPRSRARNRAHVSGTVPAAGLLQPFGMLRASASRTAMRTATPISTCSRMSDCAPSATKVSISTPRFIGPGCMTSAPGLA
jgi:hypothetical protein